MDCPWFRGIEAFKLQQVLLNLIPERGLKPWLLEARSRELFFDQHEPDHTGVLVAVPRFSVPVTLPLIIGAHLSSPFLQTTKSGGTGWAVRYCGSIIDAHGVKLCGFG